MLSLEEAIQHCEEVAEKQEITATSNLMEIDKIKADGILRLYDADEYESCMKCAAEHRQLAEWLRELKKLREIPDELVPKYRDGIRDEYNRGANEMLEEVIDDIRKYIEEVNADECSD